MPTIAKVDARRKATQGGTVTLTGTNLTGTTSVTFQGVPAKFKVVSAAKLAFTVPAEGEDRDAHGHEPVRYRDSGS